MNRYFCEVLKNPEAINWISEIYDKFIKTKDLPVLILKTLAVAMVEHFKLNTHIKYIFDYLYKRSKLPLTYIGNILMDTYLLHPKTEDDVLLYSYIILSYSGYYGEEYLKRIENKYPRLKEINNNDYMINDTDKAFDLIDSIDYEELIYQMIKRNERPSRIVCLLYYIELEEPDLDFDLGQLIAEYGFPDLYYTLSDIRYSGKFAKKFGPLTLIIQAADVSRDRVKEVAKWFTVNVLDHILNNYIFYSEDPMYQQQYTNFDSVIMAILYAIGNKDSTYPTNVPPGGKIWYWLESFSKDV